MNIDLSKQTPLEKLRAQTRRTARAAVKRASKNELRYAIPSVLHYDSNEPLIEIKTDNREGNFFLCVTFHSHTSNAHERARRLTKDEALQILGFSWKKLGLADK